MYRARIGAIWSELNGWCWWYDIYDPAGPDGNQTVTSGGLWNKWEDVYPIAIRRLWEYNARAEMR